MRRATQAELTERIFGYLDAGTTAMAEATYANPVSVYTSAEQAAAERETLFRRRLQFFGLSALWKEPGDYRTDDASGVPVLVVRNRQGRLEAFLNVCRHRGARVVDGDGSGCRGFTCPYHGWGYALDGSLARIPGEAGFDGLDRGRHGLRRLPLVERDGLVWVRPAPYADGEAPVDLDAHLAGLADELASYGFGDYHHFATRRLTPQINWKIAVDGFLEAYHLASLHGATVGPIFVSDLCASDAFGPHHRMIAVRRSFEQMRDQPAAAREFLKHTIELYTLFPNTVFVHQADHVEAWRMFPDPERVDRCVVELALYTPEPATTDKARAYWQKNLDLALDAVDTEDFRLGEGMQVGFASGAQDAVTFGRNEPGLIHFYRTLAAALADAR